MLYDNLTLLQQQQIHTIHTSSLINFLIRVVPWSCFYFFFFILVGSPPLTLVRIYTRVLPWTTFEQKGHAMGRLLRPVDIAATVGHLLSDASAMMTGTIVDLHPEMASEIHTHLA